LKGPSRFDIFSTLICNPSIILDPAQLLAFRNDFVLEANLGIDAKYDYLAT
jgi:hypothetical protein